MYINEKTVTILNTETESEILDLTGSNMFGLVVPAGFLGGTISFSVSLDGVGFHGLYKKDNSEEVVSVTDDKFINLDLAVHAGYNFVKLVAASAQDADRVIKISNGNL